MAGGAATLGRMTTTATAAPAVEETADPPRTRSLLAGMATMLASGLSNQVGAAVGAHAFGAIGPAGVVAVRQLVAAAVLVPVARPPFRRFTWAQWWPVLLLALVFGGMNLSLYTAVGRLGLGLAVTLEFLGPLAVAVGGSRTRLDALCAAGAAAGVYVLVLPGPSSDWVGLALALTAATGWASYIVLNRLVGRRLPGLQAPAAATSLSALAFAPVMVVLVADGRLTGPALLCATAAGVLSTVMPYAADVVTLRRVPARFFGVFMSVNPVLAALAGLVLLHQVLGLHEWVGVAVVVLANAVSVASARRPGPPRTGRRLIASGRPASAAAPRRRARPAGTPAPMRPSAHRGSRSWAAWRAAPAASRCGCCG